MVSSSKTVRSRASAICVDKDKLLVVWLEDPHTKTVYPFPPGGKIEADESPSEAAERECFEETGYLVKADESSQLTLPYDFPWNGEMVPCETHFFKVKLVTAEREKITPTDPYLIKTEWVPLSRVATLFSFHETILRAVQTLA